ncbi:unnamed protein product [Vitrella brassicaformis CCMP3155]|uniref:Uncharacterized protein n=1 Tax=Vitrella brassicaformis (strain CCMP3155) TaxID=1169540 RepID=A0A0G4F9I6_VITBC|nr:unnamed protein product [Vitrella brassicaformis CCMP3155]|eukprot:CEM09027.1 unnamed protein product [Vitrella brassicaformis CCMP3155]
MKLLLTALLIATMLVTTASGTPSRPIDHLASFLSVGDCPADTEVWFPVGGGESQQWKKGKKRQVEELLTDAINDLNLQRAANPLTVTPELRPTQFRVTDARLCRRQKGSVVTHKGFTGAEIHVIVHAHSLHHGQGDGQLNPFVLFRFNEMLDPECTDEQDEQWNNGTGTVCRIHRFFRFQPESTIPYVHQLAAGDVVNGETAVQLTNPIVKEAATALQQKLDGLCKTKRPRWRFSAADDVFASYVQFVGRGVRVRLEFEIPMSGHGCRQGDHINGPTTEPSYHRFYHEVRFRGVTYERSPKSWFAYHWGGNSSKQMFFKEGQIQLPYTRMKCRNQDTCEEDFFCRDHLPNTIGICRFLFPGQSPRQFFLKSNPKHSAARLE